MARKTSTKDTSGQSVLQRIDEFERRRAGTDPVEGDGDGQRLIVPEAPVSGTNRTVLPDGWSEAHMPRTSSVRKWAFRWSVLALLVACGVAIALGLGWYMAVAEDEAAKVTDGYRAALVRVEGAIPGGETAMVAITSQETTAEQLVLDLAPFTTFQGAVASLSGNVRAELPTTPPFAPRDALEEIEPLRADLALVGGRGDGLAGRLSKLITYRLVFEEMFKLPELPTQATSAELDALSPTLAGAIADSVRGLTELPSDEFLDDHRASAQELLDFIRDWQPGYVTALQVGDEQQADLLAQRIAGRIRQVREGVEEPLGVFRAWAETEFAGLRRDVSAGLVLVGP